MYFKFYFSSTTHILQSMLNITSGFASLHLDAGWISRMGGTYIPESHFNTRMTRNNLVIQETDYEANEFTLQNLD